jgi:hypothetical protein
MLADAGRNSNCAGLGKQEMTFIEGLFKGVKAYFLIFIYFGPKPYTSIPYTSIPYTLNPLLNHQKISI